MLDVFIYVGWLGPDFLASDGKKKHMFKIVTISRQTLDRTQPVLPLFLPFHSRHQRHISELSLSSLPARPVVHDDTLTAVVEQVLLHVKQ